MDYDIFEKIMEAFETSTPSNNRFLSVINSIRWDEKFFADGEHYFCKGGFTFTTPSLEPFEISRDWMPGAMFSDGSYIEF